ncbi:hypothetical protein [Streptomyces sp. WMMB303]|uniref:hypothetical protein n=1 Tax=unclassified Streptomyces TaxID=2593676 RepID=UPI0023EADCBE|nr:hypothetical protein [Streptomyces sp. WMMB303]MDF4254688.1 hypothetical protein [Streptomyces sp. WMMB303]
MRTPSRLTTTLATFLFSSPTPTPDFPRDPERLGEMIREAEARLGTADAALSSLAYAYGDHPETAAERMATCLRAVKVVRPQVHLPQQKSAVAR